MTFRSRATRWIPASLRQLYWYYLEARDGDFVGRELLWQCVTRLPEFTITRTTQHGRISFSNRDNTIGRWLFVKGGYEHHLIHHALAVANTAGHLDQVNGGVLFDVGANLGTVCVPLIRRGVFASAVAIEPEPRNFSLLRRNLALNNIAHIVTAVNCAVSSSVGTCTMEVSPGNFGDCRLRAKAAARRPALMGEERWRTIEVPVDTVDRLITRLGIDPEDVRLVWMDVQGYELHVLDGADDLLRRSRAPVVMEFWPYALARAGVSDREFAAGLQSRFDQFYDLNDAAPIQQPIASVGTLFERYTALDSSNLLLVRH